MQIFVRGDCTMIAAPVQCELMEYRRCRISQAYRCAESDQVARAAARTYRGQFWASSKPALKVDIVSTAVDA